MRETSSEQTVAAKKKSMTTALLVISVIGVLYALFYVYLFATGTFDADRHLLGLVPLGGLFVIGAATYSTRAGLDDGSDND